MIHTFKKDFYGEVLSVVMVGYIRPERSYNSLGRTPFSVFISPSFTHSHMLMHTLFLSHKHTQVQFVYACSQRHNMIHASRFDLAIFPLKPPRFPPCTSLSLLVFISPSFLFLTEALIAAINNDIEEAKVKLELPEHLKLKDDNFFTSAPSSLSALPPTTASTSQTIMNGH